VGLTQKLPTIAKPLNNEDRPHRGAQVPKADSKRLLVVAINYAPEPTGIGKYVGEMTDWLAARGVEVRVVTAPPYYPHWSVQKGYRGSRYAKEQVGGVTVLRCPIWVPTRPRGITRILHLLSFALSSFPVVLWQALTWRPDMVFVVEPPLAAAPGARLAALVSGARSWLHVQDFEVDAAFDLGLLRAPLLRRLVLGMERWLMRRFDHVSSISDAMRTKLRAKGVREERIALFPNWVDTALIRPTGPDNALREELKIGPETQVILYSGNMGEKQGLDLILDVARCFSSDRDVLFVLCGDGAVRPRIDQAAADLTNVRLIPLQPHSRLNELLNLAVIHLLPQRAAAEDLVLPSKLTAIMASGRPVVAAARSGSDVARSAGEGGIVVPPGDVSAFERAIRHLLEDDALRARLGAAARAYARQNWERDRVLQQTFARLPTFASSSEIADAGPTVESHALADSEAFAGTTVQSGLTNAQ
jgi:colanic acid biosynthesis glycosyl transferase WcaI